MKTKLMTKESSFSICANIVPLGQTYPYIFSQDGDKDMYCLSPIHCRSFIVGRHDDGRYIVSKGNGLAFSQHTFMYTPEMPTDVWGLLRKEDALRDYYCGQDVQALGIKTNQMECVLELDYPIYIPQTKETIKPCLLQYSVECPWRIADAGFMDRNDIWLEVHKWDRLNDKNFQEDYLIAANVLIRNLRILHDHGVLHNALTYENLTWASELLDFELCHTPQHPYTKADYARHVPDLFDREVIDIYKLINYIAGVLNQPVNYSIVDALFYEYGFDIAKYKVCNHQNPNKY